MSKVRHENNLANLAKKGPWIFALIGLIGASLYHGIYYLVNQSLVTVSPIDLAFGSQIAIPEHLQEPMMLDLLLAPALFFLVAANFLHRAKNDDNIELGFALFAGLISSLATLLFYPDIGFLVGFVATIPISVWLVVSYPLKEAWIYLTWYSFIAGHVAALCTSIKYSFVIGGFYGILLGTGIFLCCLLGLGLGLTIKKFKPKPPPRFNTEEDYAEQLK